MDGDEEGEIEVDAAKLKPKSKNSKIGDAVKLKPKAKKSKGPKRTSKGKSKTLIPPACEVPSKPNKRLLECGAYTPHAYNEQRTSFIGEQRAKGLSYAVANAAWNLSREKAHLLAKVPVNELIRRRFLPKGSKANPWSEVP